MSEGSVTHTVVHVYTVRVLTTHSSTFEQLSVTGQVIHVGGPCALLLRVFLIGIVLKYFIKS